LVQKWSLNEACDFTRTSLDIAVYSLLIGQIVVAAWWARIVFHYNFVLTAVLVGPWVLTASISNLLAFETGAEREVFSSAAGAPESLGL
jgi:hypothetical protein